MTDFANHAAALAGGYQRVQGSVSDVKGLTTYFSRYEKILTGQPGETDVIESAEATSTVDQATADTAVLAALNEQRQERYGAGSALDTGTDVAATPEVLDAT